MSPVGITRTLWQGRWSRTGRPPIFTSTPTVDNFVLGVTEPTELNTGVLPDVTRIAYSGPTIIDGSLDPAKPTPIESRNISQLLTIRSGYVRFFNCLFTGGGATSDTGLVDCRASGIGRVWFERCTFSPGDPTPFLNALIGHHMTVHRCQSERTVDFIGVYNTTGPRVDVFITGNLLKNLVYYEAATVGVVHPSDVRTHNDAIQIQSGLGVTVEGNALHGYLFREDGTLPPTVSGVEYRLASQGVLIQENVAIGGVYYGGEAKVNNNWIYGFMHPFSFKTRSTGGTPFNVEATGNRLMNDDQRYYGTTDFGGLPGRPYIFRTGTETTINGVTTVPTDGNPYPVGGNNRYANSPSVVRASLRGEIVTIRRDNFAGG